MVKLKATAKKKNILTENLFSNSYMQSFTETKYHLIL